MIDALEDALDVDDLEADKRPEDLMLSYVSVEKGKDCSDRELVTPWFKFLYLPRFKITKRTERRKIVVAATASSAASNARSETKDLSGDDCVQRHRRVVQQPANRYEWIASPQAINFEFPLQVMVKVVEVDPGLKGDTTQYWQPFLLCLIRKRVCIVAVPSNSNTTKMEQTHKKYEQVAPSVVLSEDLKELAGGIKHQKQPNGDLEYHCTLKRDCFKLLPYAGKSLMQ
ncbi:eukaryotic translation initiation factor 3 subunit A [Tanacetum coccineum]